MSPATAPEEMTDDLVLASAQAIAALLRAELDDYYAEMIHLPRGTAALTLGLVEAMVEILSGNRSNEP